MLYESEVAPHQVMPLRSLIFVETPRKTKSSLVRSVLSPISPVMLKYNASLSLVAIKSSSSSRFRTEIEVGVSRRFDSVREPDVVWVERYPSSFSPVTWKMESISGSSFLAGSVVDWAEWRAGWTRARHASDGMKRRREVMFGSGVRTGLLRGSEVLSKPPCAVKLRLRDRPYFLGQVVRPPSAIESGLTLHPRAAEQVAAPLQENFAPRRTRRAGPIKVADARLSQLAPQGLPTAFSQQLQIIPL